MKDSSGRLVAELNGAGESPWSRTQWRVPDRANAGDKYTVAATLDTGPLAGVLRAAKTLVVEGRQTE